MFQLREPLGSRFCLVVATLTLSALLASCGPLGHWTGGVAGLPARDGWSELPIGRWLAEGPVTVEAFSICPPDTCARQGAVAALVLHERERAVAAELARNPARFAAAALRAMNERKLRQRSRLNSGGALRIMPKPVEIAGWRGAAFQLTSAAGSARSAYVLALAAPAHDRLLIAVSDSREGASAHAARALGLPAPWP